MGEGSERLTNSEGDSGLTQGESNGGAAAGKARRHVVDGWDGGTGAAGRGGGSTRADRR